MSSAADLPRVPVARREDETNDRRTDLPRRRESRHDSPRVRRSSTRRRSAARHELPGDGDRAHRGRWMGEAPRRDEEFLGRGRERPSRDRRRELSEDRFGRRRAALRAGARPFARSVPPRAHRHGDRRSPRRPPRRTQVRGRARKSARRNQARPFRVSRRSRLRALRTLRRGDLQRAAVHRALDAREGHGGTALRRSFLRARDNQARQSAPAAAKGVDRDDRRRRHRGNRSAHDAVEDRPGALLRRRSDGHRRPDRRLQPKKEKTP